MDQDKRLFWTKVALKSYRLIPGWLNCIDTVRGKMVSYGVGHKNERMGLTNEELFDRMLTLNYRMHGLVNLKVLVDQGLSKLPKIYAEVVEGMYLGKEDVLAMAERFGVKPRTIYRRIDKGVELLSKKFAGLGYTPEKFEWEYKEEPLLDIVKKRLEKSENNYSS